MNFQRIKKKYKPFAIFAGLSYNKINTYPSHYGGAVIFDCSGTSLACEGRASQKHRDKNYTNSRPPGMTVLVKADDAFALEKTNKEKIEEMKSAICVLEKRISGRGG